VLANHIQIITLRMNLIGNWSGYYEYGEGYALPHFGERVNISVVLDGNNDKFIGTVKEDGSEYSVPLKATIQGFSEDQFVSFIKRYPKIPRIIESGSSELEMDNGSLEIEHVGSIDAKFNSMYGSWTIIQDYEDEQGTYQEAVHGIWMLKKVD